MEESTKLTISEIENLISDANASSAEIRHVSEDAVVEVMRRTIVASAALSLESKRFAVRKAVNNFVSLVTSGKPENGSVEHADLLPIAHPESSANHLLSTAELRSLRAEWIAADPRVSEKARSVVASALSATPGDVIQLHSATRLRVLVAAGEVPADVANADTNSEVGQSNGPTEEQQQLRKMVDDYYAARYNFLGILSNQVSLNTGANLYDHKGELSHMIERGDTKQNIKDYLMKNVYFAGKLEDMNKPVPEEDFFGSYSQQQFGMFYDALNQLIDPPFPPDFRENAIEALSEKYDWQGAIADAIRSGASSGEVLSILNTYPQWTEDADDYESRGDVEAPTNAKKEQWGTFRDTYLAIKDIDAQPVSTTPVAASASPFEGPITLEELVVEL